MKITVTGGRGFLGSHVADELSKRGHKVIIFDKKKSKWIRSDQKMFIGNILNPNDLENVIKNTDVVFHFAALSDLDVAATRPLETAKVNIVGTINALTVSREHGVKRFIYASSIYANTEEGGFYGSSKKAAEDYIERFHATFGLNYTILRFGSLYGSRSDESNGLNAIINSGLKKKKLIYAGNIKAVRRYIHVEDAVNICAKVVNKKYENKYLIITGKRLVKIKNLMKMLSKYLNIPSNKIEYLNEYNRGHYDVKPTPFVSRSGKYLQIKKEKNFKKNLVYLVNELKKRHR